MFFWWFISICIHIMGKKHIEHLEWAEFMRGHEVRADNKATTVQQDLGPTVPLCIGERSVLMMIDDNVFLVVYGIS
jgi:hypothetical protein